MSRSALVVFAVSLLACTGEATDSAGTVECDGKVHVSTQSLTSDGDGVVELVVPVDANDDAFMVMVERGGGTVSTNGVVDPAGAVVLDWSDWTSSRESLTNAFYASTDVTVLNWPVREQDGPLSPGDWVVSASTLDGLGYAKGNQSVDVTLIRRSCLVDKPTLPVTIVYVGGLESDDEVSGAVSRAAARWAELYDARGLAIDVSFVSADANGSVEEPLLGDDLYEELYGEVEGGVVVVVADDVGGYADLYGEAGGIPGPYVASTHSAVAVSWLVHAGSDASFSDDEVEVLAETMAHEVGHYLGLYHPVEMSWNAWDALDDTKRCNAEGACEDALADNLMFPYPVCGAQSCVAQTELTGDQAGVLSLNVGFR